MLTSSQVYYCICIICTPINFRETKGQFHLSNWVTWPSLGALPLFIGKIICFYVNLRVMPDWWRWSVWERIERITAEPSDGMNTSSRPSYHYYLHILLNNKETHNNIVPILLCMVLGTIARVYSAVLYTLLGKG